MEEKLTQTYQQELSAKLLVWEKEYTNKLEIQQKESDAILKECQTISEFNIIQSEIEKNKIKTELETKVKDLFVMTQKYEKSIQNCDKLSIKFKNLENDFNGSIKELNETREMLTEEVKKNKKL